MSVSSFGGLWTYPSTIIPEHDDFMFINEDRRRIITFVLITADPTKRIPMRNWYQPMSDTSISTRLRPTEEWCLLEFQLQGNRLIWSYGGREHAWQRVLWEQRPNWLEAELVAANFKMDETEKNT